MFAVTAELAFSSLNNKLESATSDRTTPSPDPIGSP
jgi:hypothetical protein